MPRRRRYESRFTRRNNVWVPFPVPTTVTGTVPLSAGATFFVDSFPTEGNDDWEVTLERVRGEFIIDPQYGGANLGWLYIWIHPKVILKDIAARTDVSGKVPAPGNADGIDDFPLCLPLCAPSASATAFPVDSKARRKIDKDHAVSVFLYAHNDFGATKFNLLARMLTTLRS